jgi:REP element-mobilizing transposase RayT
MRVVPGVGYLRAQSRAKAIESALHEAAERYGVRIVHYSIQGNHLHLLVEAEDQRALSRAMQGLAIRLAKRLNRLAHRSGSVFADRYHAHSLTSRREVANAVRYVLGNDRTTRANTCRLVGTTHMPRARMRRSPRRGHGSCGWDGVRSRPELQREALSSSTTAAKPTTARANRP